MSRYKKLVVATDFSETAEHAVQVAGHLAKRLDASVALVHVVSPSLYAPVMVPSTIPDLISVMRKNATRRLADLQQKHLAGTEAQPVVLDGHNPALAVADFARDNDIDLCVVGTHGRTGLTRLLIGSVAEVAVRHMPCDVLTVPRQATDDVLQVKSMMVAVDFSDTSLSALEVAAALAARVGAELHLLHVVDPSVPIVPEGSVNFENPTETKKKRWSELSALRAEKVGTDVDAFTEVVIHKDPASALKEYAEAKGIGLTVLGTHGRTGLSRLLLGSVAERALRFVPGASLVVRRADGDVGV